MTTGHQHVVDGLQYVTNNQDARMQSDHCTSLAGLAAIRGGMGFCPPSLRTFESQVQQERQAETNNRLNASAGLVSPIIDRASYNSSTSTSPNLPNVAILRPGRTSTSTCFPSPCPSDDSGINMSGDNPINLAPGGGQNGLVAVQTSASGHQTAVLSSPSNTTNPVFAANVQPNYPQTPQIVSTAQTQSHPPVPPPSLLPVYSQAHIPHQMSPTASVPIISSQEPSQIPVNLPRPNYIQIPYFKNAMDRLNSFTIQHPSPSQVTSFIVDLVRQAIHEQDAEFLIIHQLYCLLRGPSKDCPRSLTQNKKVNHIYGFLRTVIAGRNEEISQIYHEFFCTFPVPLPEFETFNPQLYQSSLQRFSNMVEISDRFDTFFRFWHSRLSPPLVDELLQLNVTSLTLQRRIFLLCLQGIHNDIEASCRRQQPVFGRLRFENDCLQLFKQHQIEFYNLPPGFVHQKKHNAARYENMFRTMRDQFYNVNLSSVHAPNSQGQPQPGSQPQGHQLQAAQPQALRHGQAPAASLHSTHARASQNIRAAQYTPNSQNIQSFVPQHSQLAPSRPGSAATRGSNAPVPNQMQHSGRPDTANGSRQRPVISLLPSKGHNRPYLVEPTPAITALHQAHLRSPVLKAQEPKSKLYQYVKHFAFHDPRKLTVAGKQVEEWTFTMTDEMFRVLPQIVAGQDGSPPTKYINKNTEALQLRCIKWNATGIPDEHTWATTETTWVPYAFFAFNDKPLELRKKLNYGKDLPVDITSYLRNGKNVLQIGVLKDNQDWKDYVVGIEVVGTMTHEDIKAQCNSLRRQSAEQILTTIKSKLSEHLNEDEVFVVKSSLTISLVDPFTASRMCDIPVRAKNCLHDDCFDLETFLATRPRKGDSSDSEKWRCPICRGDARPHQLMINGFHQQVRKELEERGLAETRAIIVQQDGTWVPKIEPEKDDPNPGSTDSGRQSAQVISPPANVFTIPDGIEVIDLLD